MNGDFDPDLNEVFIDTEAVPLLQGRVRQRLHARERLL